MSAPMFKQDVKFLQRFLKCSGLYSGKIDGSWGPITEAAFADFENRSRVIRGDLGEFDTRSEQNILTLHFAPQTAARKVLRSVLDAGIQAKILSGTRTYAEQNELYALGRTKPGSKVTNAQGGESNHNFGLAWDLGIWVGGFYDGKKSPRDKTLEKEAEEAYGAAAKVALALKLAGLEWGGNWTKPDRPHYQMSVAMEIPKIRTSFERGDPYIDLLH